MKNLPTKYDISFWACVILSQMFFLHGDSTFDNVISVLYLALALLCMYFGHNTYITAHKQEGR